jgi:hypothetical protein
VPKGVLDQVFAPVVSELQVVMAKGSLRAVELIWRTQQGEYW